MDLQPAMITLYPEQVIPIHRCTAAVSGDVALTGSLRDVPNVLHASAYAVIERTEAMQDKLSVSGRVVFRVMYAQGEPAHIDAIEATADFTHICDAPGLTPRSAVTLLADAVNVKASVSGGRMSLRADVAMQGRAVSTDPVEAVTHIPGSSVQQQTETIRLLHTSASGCGDVLLREEFALPADLDIRDTLGADAVVTLNDATGGQGRIGLSGDVALTAVHLSGTPGKPILTTRHTMPVQESVSITGDGGDLLSGRMTVKDVAVASQTTDDGSVLRAEVLLGMCASSEENASATVLTDAYTTSGDALKLTRTNLDVRTGSVNTHAAESFKATAMLPEGAKPLRTLLAAFAAPHADSWSQQGNRLHVNGTMDVTLIYMPDDGAAPASVTVALPLRASFAAEAAQDDLITLTAADVEAVPITSDRCEVRCILHLTVDGVRTQHVSLVTGVTAVPAGQDVRDIILYFVQPGETWWDVARRYRTTTDRLHALNPDVPGELQAGQGVIVWVQTTAD